MLQGPKSPTEFSDFSCHTHFLNHHIKTKACGERKTCKREVCPKCMLFISNNHYKAQ